MSLTLKDWDDHVDVDLVFRYLGRFGSYQIVQYVQILLGILPTAVNIFANVFTGFEPDYKCQRLDNETQLKLQHEIQGNIKFYYEKCEIIVEKANKPSVVRTMTCVNNYDYTSGKYKSFISEWDLVCDQEEFSKLATTVFHVGMMIGAALFPSLADKYGRKPVYVGARIGSLFVNLMVLVSPSYSFLLVCRFLCGLLQPGMNVPGTIMIAELFPTENRTHVLLLGGVMWVSGVMMMAPIAYMFQNFNWRILHAVFALFFCPSLIEIWSIDESIRWLIAKDRWTEAKHLIRKAAKKNDVDYNQVAYLYRHFDPLGSEASKSDTSSQIADNIVDTTKLNSMQPIDSIDTGEISSQITDDTKNVNTSEIFSNNRSQTIQDKDACFTNTYCRHAKQINLDSSKIGSTEMGDRNLVTTKINYCEVKNADISKVCPEQSIVDVETPLQKDFQRTVNTILDTENTSCQQTVYVSANIDNNGVQQTEKIHTVVNTTPSSLQQQLQDTNVDIKVKDTPFQHIKKLNVDTDIEKTPLKQTKGTPNIANTNVNSDEIYLQLVENADLKTFQTTETKNKHFLRRAYSAIISPRVHIQNEDLGIRVESMPCIHKTLANTVYDTDRYIDTSNEQEVYLNTYKVWPEGLQVDRNIYNLNNNNNSVKCNGRIPGMKTELSGSIGINESLPVITSVFKHQQQQQQGKIPRGGEHLTETVMSARTRCQLPGMLYIIKEPVLRRMVFICLYLWFVNTLVYYGLYFTSESLAGNRYLNFFLYALAEFPSQVLALKLLIRIGRKKTCILFQSIAGGSLIVAVIFRMSSSKDSYAVMAATVFSLIGMFGISGSFLVNWLYIPELFPTRLRNAGMGLASTASRIGSMLSPFSGILARYISWGPSVIFAFFCLVANLLVLALPETVHRQLPQSVGDIRRWSDERDETWDSQTLQQMVRLIVMGSAQTDDRGRRT